jgi:hypothetical protein
MSEDDPELDGEHGERFFQRPWFQPLIGVLIIAFVLLAGPVYGRITAGGKISPDIDRDAELVNVIVDLTVDVTTFHREELSSLGIYAGIDRDNPGDRSRVRMQRVTQDDLTELSRLYWVDQIEASG